MAQTFDVIVIGSGSAGRRVASACGAEGWKVAVIDRRPLGGTCPLRGCIPKKVLVAVAGAVDHARRLRGRGIGGDDPRLDWEQLFRFQRSFVEPVPARQAKQLHEQGIATFQETAVFTGPRSLRCGTQELEARRAIVVASGARPARLGIPGEDLVTSSDDFFELGDLPPRVAFLGGGYISFELAHVAARAGAEVVILEQSERVLAGFDPDLVDLLVARSREARIDVQTRTEALAVGERNGTLLLRARGPEGEVGLEVGLVVHGAGRVPALDDLELEVAGVEHDERGVCVDEHMRSVSNPHVFAAGDCAGRGLPLTPVASAQGHVVAANLLGEGPRTFDDGGTPSVVFTLPPLARVGLLEEEARGQGLDVEVKFEQTSEWFSARHLGERTAGHKLLLERGSGRILGAHLLGPAADELIAVFTLALRKGLTAADLREIPWVFPTRASDVTSML